MRILFVDPKPRTEKSVQPYDIAKIEALLNSYASPGTKVEIGFPDDFAGSQLMLTIGAQSALNGLHHMMETPSIVRKIFWAAEHGYDAVISSNTFDPGVGGGRLAVGIPVIGLLRASMHAALTLADRVGITVPLAPHVPYTWRILRTLGLDRFVSDIRPIGIYGADIARRGPEIFDKTVTLMRALGDVIERLARHRCDRGRSAEHDQDLLLARPDRDLLERPLGDDVPLLVGFGETAAEGQHQCQCRRQCHGGGATPFS